MMQEERAFFVRGGASDTTLRLGDVIRATVPDLPLLDDAEAAVVYVDHQTLVLVVVDPEDPRYSTRHEFTVAQFQELFRDAAIHFVDRAAERGFARQNGLLPGQWIQVGFRDGTALRGVIRRIEEDMIVLRTEEGGSVETKEEQEEEEEEEQDMYIDFAYRGLPLTISSLCFIADPDAPRARGIGVATAPFADVPMDQIQQLMDEMDEEEEEEVLFPEREIAASNVVFNTYTLGAQIDDLMTALLSRYSDEQRTPSVVQRAQALVQRYCAGRRTAMVHHGERAVHWIVPPPVPVDTAWTEQQSPIGDDTFGRRGKSTKVGPVTIPRWLVPVIAKRQRVFVSAGELIQINADDSALPDDVEPVSMVGILDESTNAIKALTGTGEGGKRAMQIYAERMRLWRNLNPPLERASAMIPEIRSRYGIEAVVSNSAQLNAFEHHVVDYNATGLLLSENVKKRKKKQKNNNNKKKTKRRKASGGGPIDFGDDDEYVPDEDEDDDEDDDATDDQEEGGDDGDDEDEELLQMILGDDSQLPALAFARQHSAIVRLLPSLQILRTKQLNDRDGNEFPALPATDRLMEPVLIQGDAAAVRSVLCVPAMATSVRHSLYERILAVDGAPPLWEYVAAARGREVIDVTHHTWQEEREDRRQQEQQARLPPFGRALVHARLDESSVASLDNNDRLELLLKRTIPGAASLLAELPPGTATTSLDRVLHSLAPFGAATRALLSVSDILLRQALREGQDAVRQAMTRRRDQAHRVQEAKYPGSWAAGGGGKKEEEEEEEEDKEAHANHDIDRIAVHLLGDSEGDPVDLASKLRGVYLPTGRGGAALQEEEEAVMLEAAPPRPSEQLLGWIYQDGGASLSALVAHATAGLTLDMPLLLGTTAKKHAAGTCAPRVLAKTYASAKEMNDDRDPVFDADLDPVDYALARKLKDAYRTAMAPTSGRRLASSSSGEYDYILSDIVKSQVYGPLADYPRFARSMVTGKHAVVPGNYAAVSRTGPGINAPVRTFYVRKRPNQPGSTDADAVWTLDPSVQDDIAFMTTFDMLCEIRSIRSPGKNPTNVGPDAFCLASSPSSSSKEEDFQRGNLPAHTDKGDAIPRPRKQCVTGLALMEQRRTALLDELARRQHAAFKYSADQWLFLAERGHGGRRTTRGGGKGHRRQQLIGSLSAKLVIADRCARALSMRAMGDVAPTAQLLLRPENSPHFPLWREIDGGSLGVEKRFQAIVQFADTACREPIVSAGESPHWLVCTLSGAPLVPVVLRQLAAAYLSGTYLALLEQLCNQAETNDMGEVVHSATGTVLRQDDLVVEYRFDADAANSEAQVQTLRQQSGAEVWGTTTTNTDAIGSSSGYGAVADSDSTARNEIQGMVQGSEDGKFLLRYISELMKHMSIGGGNVMRRTAMRYALAIAGYKLIVTDKKTYEASRKQEAEAAAAAVGKSSAISLPTSYDAFLRQRKIAAAAVGLLVAIQAHRPGIVARKAFRGCTATFEGYPLVEDTSRFEAVQYIACILVAMSDSGGKDFVGTKMNRVLNTTKLLVSRIISIAVKYVPAVSDALSEKRAFLIAAESSSSSSSSRTRQPARDDFVIDGNAFFLPPLRPIPPPSATGAANSSGQIRIQRLAMALVHALRGHLVKQQLLLMTRDDNQPFLNNACCESSPVDYAGVLVDYARRDPAVLDLLRELRATAVELASTKIIPSTRRLPPRASSGNVPASIRLLDSMPPLVRVRAAQRYCNLGRGVAPTDTAAFCPPSSNNTTNSVVTRLRQDALSLVGFDQLKDLDGKSLSADDLAELQGVAEHMTDAKTQGMLTTIFRRSLAPPTHVAAAIAADPALQMNAASLDSRTAESLQYLQAIARAGAVYEQKLILGGTELADASRTLRDTLYAALRKQMAALHKFLEQYRKDREPTDSTISRDKTDYAALLNLGGPLLVNQVLQPVLGTGLPLARNVKQFMIANAANAPATLGPETGAAQMYDYFSEISNAWGCVYLRKLLPDEPVLAAPHAHWGLDTGDRDFVQDRLDAPFHTDAAPASIVAFGAMQGGLNVAVVHGVQPKVVREDLRQMWNKASDAYVKTFRDSADAFRRRAVAWIPSSLGDSVRVGVVVDRPEELAQMGCLSLLLHVCLLCADASGAPEDGSVVGLSLLQKHRVDQMALYVSRLTNTLHTGELAAYREPVATTYQQIAEKIAFSNDREKESLKKTFRDLENRDKNAARLERELRKNHIGVYGINVNRLNKYGERNAQGFIASDLNAHDQENIVNYDDGDHDDDYDDDHHGDEYGREDGFEANGDDMYDAGEYYAEH